MVVKSAAKATRQLSIIVVAAAVISCTIKPAVSIISDTKQYKLRRAPEDMKRQMGTIRALMPILDGHYSNVTGEYELINESHGGDHDHSGNYGDDCGNSKDVDGEKIAIVIASIGVAMVLITVCLTWKACVECCTRSSRRSRHRAFIARSDAGWKCEICVHKNDFSNSECVLCGTSIEELKLTQSHQEDAYASTAVTSRVKENSHSSPNYVLISSPLTASRQDVNSFRSVTLNDRQLVARERHKWKRCIAGANVHWVRIPIEGLKGNEILCSTITKERDYQEWHRHHSPALPDAAQSSAPSADSLRGSRQHLTSLNINSAFVRDTTNSDNRIVIWRLTDEFLAPSRQYSKAIVRASSLSFSRKAQWFYQYSHKLCPSLVDKYYTIRICRDKILKQSMALFMSAPSKTLYRRIRIDFMGEVGIDGGGLLREWLHLLCNELFSGALGLFTLTSSSAHQGYWIQRTSTEKSSKQLEMYVFFGKLLGKALLDGLLLNVRLSIPLLKHILGVPLTSYDLYLLDETVYSSMMWILTNSNTSTLALNFTVEGVELVPSGTDVTLHDGNKHLYVAKLVQYYLFDSIKAEVSSIVEGLCSVIDSPILHVFDYMELDLLLSGLPQIDINDWRQNTDVRFFENSPHEFEVITWFWEVLESFSQDQCSRFLQYVTGSSGVPVEGFKGLTGTDGDIQPFTIQLCKDVETAYTILPHASTCANRLDLPLYSSKAKLEHNLKMVVKMDVTGFNSR